MYRKYVASHKGKLFNDQSLYFRQDIKVGQSLWDFVGEGGQEKALKLPT